MPIYGYPVHCVGFKWRGPAIHSPLRLGDNALLQLFAYELRKNRVEKPFWKVSVAGVGAVNSACQYFKALKTDKMWAVSYVHLDVTILCPTTERTVWFSKILRSHYDCKEVFKEV